MFVTAGDRAGKTQKHGRTLLAAGNMNTGSAFIINNISRSFSFHEIVLSSVTVDTATRHLQLQVSADNGITFDTTAGNYTGWNSSGATFSAVAEASLWATADVAATNARKYRSFIYGLSGTNGGIGNILQLGYLDDASTPNMSHTTNKFAEVNAFKILISGSGSFNGGSYAFYGYR